MNKGVVHVSVRTVVDMTRFTGAVDWSTLHSIRDMGPSGTDGESRVAYVVRNNVFRRDYQDYPDPVFEHAPP